MTPDQFRADLAALGWSQMALADYLYLNPITVRRWAAPGGCPPANIATWLANLANIHRQNPFPV